MIYYAKGTFVGKKPRDEAHLGLANVYYEMKLPKQVIAEYKKAVAENYKNHKALYLLANFSDNYYKDKKIAYNHYKKYIARFESKDSILTATVKKRQKEIKKK